MEVPERVVTPPPTLVELYDFNAGSGVIHWWTIVGKYKRIRCCCRLLLPVYTLACSTCAGSKSLAFELKFPGRQWKTKACLDLLDRRI